MPTDEGTLQYSFTPKKIVSVVEDEAALIKFPCLGEIIATEDMNERILHHKVVSSGYNPTSALTAQSSLLTELLKTINTSLRKLFCKPTVLVCTSQSSRIASNLSSSLPHHLHHCSPSSGIRLLLQPPQMFFQISESILLTRETNLQ